MPSGAFMRTAESPLPEQTFFRDPALDRALGVVMALATEVYVLRDRVRAIEAAFTANGALQPEQLAAEPGPEEMAEARADRAAELTRQRSSTLEAAFHGNPIRFKHVTPQPPEVPLAAWINPPAKKKPEPTKTQATTH